jgi:choline-sulfatase
MLSTTNTVQEILDDPRGKAVLEQHLAGLLNSSYLGMLMGMSLEQLSQHDSERLNPQKLVAIDAALRAQTSGQRPDAGGTPASPNIIFVLSDQHNPLIVGSHGDPFVRTPNLDRLTAEGAVLDNCYCGSPLCVPSRSALLSGLLPHRTGIFTNFQALPSDETTFVHALAIAGYETTLVGRMHFVGPDQRHGFSERLVGDITPSTIGVGYDNYGELRGTTGQNRQAAVKSGPGRSAVLQYDEDVLEAACAYLEQRAETSQPLFMTVGFYGPHCPFVCPRDLFDHYYDTIPRPEPLDDLRSTLHPAVRKWLTNRGILDLDLETIHRARAAYYGLIELMDRYVGRLREAVAATIGLENTLIIYSSDHGDMAGDKGMFWKSNMYEGSVRVPAIFHMPGIIPAGRRITGLTSLLDFGPTLIELTGAPSLPLADGQSIWPQLTGDETINPDRAVLSMCGDLKGDLPSAMVRQGPWKLVDHYSYATPQLFNLDDDPHEQMDLGASESHAEIRQALYEELNQVWDGAAVHEHVQRVAAYTNLRGQFNTKTGNRYPDDWRGNADANTIDDVSLA